MVGRHLSKSLETDKECKMQTVDVQARLEYARCAVAVLRALKLLGQTMTYSDFARAIGLIPDGEGWEVWYRQQVSEILSIVGATERQAGAATTEPVKFEQIVSKEGQ